MIIRMNKLILTTAIAVIANISFAQQAIVPSGQNLSGSGGSASVTIGYTSYIIKPSIVSGVQQPFGATITVVVPDSETPLVFNYDIGEDAVLQVTPIDLCSQFVKWSDGNTDNPRSITVTQDSTFTAIFEKIQFNLSVDVNDPEHSEVTTSAVED